MGDALAQHGLHQRGRRPTACRHPPAPSCTPASENQFPPGRSSRWWTRAVNRGSSMPRSCRKRRFGRPSDGVGDRLVGHQERLAAGHRAAVLADHLGQVLDVRQVADGKIADDFVGGAVGQHQHVARLTGVLRQFRHPIDEGHHHRQQGDDGGEGQRGHDGRFPTDGQIAEVVAQRDLADAPSNSSRMPTAIAESVRIIMPPSRTRWPLSRPAPTRRERSCPTGRPVRRWPAPTTARRAES